MLSGPPGVQNEQVSGTELSRKWVCFSPGSSGIMKPWMRCVFWFRASCGLSNTGSTLFFSVLVFTAVSSDQGTTSLRAGSGANGLLGSWMPGPVPGGTGELNWAPAEAATAKASKTTTLFMAVLLEANPSVLVLHSTVFSYGQALAGGLQIFLALVVLLARFQAFGRGFMGGRHGAVPLHILLDLFRALGRDRPQGQASQQQHQSFH